MTYRVVITGVNNGFSHDQVIKGLAGLFKIPEDQAKNIVRHGSFTVKKNIDLQTAVKYQAALQSKGAVAVIEDEEATQFPTEAEKNKNTGTNAADENRNVVTDENTADNNKTKINSFKKNVLAGLVAATGFGAIGLIAKTPIEEYFYQQEQQEIISKLSLVRPSTFQQSTTTRPTQPRQPINIEWDKLNPSTDLMKKTIHAMRENNDSLITKDELASIMPLSYFSGAGTEPTTEDELLENDLNQLINTNSQIAVAIGELHERNGNREAAYIWYEIGISKNIEEARFKFAALAEKNNDYFALFDLFTRPGFESTSLDLKKLAGQFGEAASQDSSYFKNIKTLALILNNGPEVAANAWKAILPTAIQSSGSEVESCNSLSSDIADPENKGKGIFPGTVGGGISECAAAVKANPSDKRLWYQLGYALQRAGEWDKSKIAYAKSAELGSPLGIARYWWIDTARDKKHAITMLEAEAAAGNPWGDYFIGMTNGFGTEELFDFSKAEIAFKKAESAGIAYSQVLLGDLFKKQKNFAAAMEWNVKAAKNFPHVKTKIGYAYLTGIGAERDINKARDWFIKADAAGEKESSDFLSRISARNGESIVGTWDCQDTIENNQPKSAKLHFSWDGKYQWDESQDGSATYGDYQRSDNKLTLIPHKSKTENFVVNLQGYKISGTLAKISDDSFNIETLWQLKNGQSSKHITSCKRIGNQNDQVILSLESLPENRPSAPTRSFVAPDTGCQRGVQACMNLPSRQAIDACLRAQQRKGC